MDRKNNDDSSERVKFVLSISAMILVVNVFVVISAWTMPTRNEEHNNSQRSISSMYSSFFGQPEKEVKE